MVAVVLVAEVVAVVVLMVPAAAAEPTLYLQLQDYKLYGIKQAPSFVWLCGYAMPHHWVTMTWVNYKYKAVS